MIHDFRHFPLSSHSWPLEHPNRHPLARLPAQAWIVEMSHSTDGYNLYQEGVEHAQREEWDCALDKLSASWCVEFHPSTAVWLSRIHEARGEQGLAFLYACAGYTLGPKMDLAAIRVAEQLIRNDGKKRAIVILENLLARNVDCALAKKMLNEFNLADGSMDC